MGNSLTSFPFKMTTDELSSWAKGAFHSGTMYKRVVNRKSIEDIYVLGVYRNWISIQGIGNDHCVQLGNLLAREEELYVQNEKGQWKLVHPFFRYDLKVESIERQHETTEQLELFAM
ncbi:hypothetical protein Desaci_4132 [Desulfosporosinus acidiphilus SJ4]|uniref:Uncharacterized protein n=1 Tax=Desulfosporosinus acidiphilus (strain DSM 22704 / JCM 16185 / SJ4) TaxID=646529 RepID=I4DB20_DESAJ|nr:hypothetical protein [Desulfosporosinus acidiphilus]AFM42994.1 hypothetical protein Desaci_4132 [Desulfosporosinus acidiphilus SJ4]